MTKVDCGRCSGKGKIAGFSHVVGGTCFLCGGAGFREVKRASKPSQKYVAVATLIATGERLRLFGFRARSEAAALRIVRTKLAGTDYDPETASVEIA